jgi:uncharacterized DUF497 family protein
VSTSDKITLHVSPDVRRKLKEKHGVCLEQVQACFENRERAYLFDTREEHQTEPQTRWFIAEYESGKSLKVCFMYFADEKRIDVKTAYPPNDEEIELYTSKAPPRATP